MRNTGFSLPRRKASRLAGLYCNRVRAQQMDQSDGVKGRKLPRRKRALCRIDGSLPSESNWITGRHCEVLSGNGILGRNRGGLVSTLSDQAQFFTMLLNGG